MRSLPHEPLEGRRMDLEGSYSRNTGQLNLIYTLYKCIYPKVYFIWVPEVGTSRGHEPIIIPSCGAVFFFRIELIEIYPTDPRP